MQNSIHLMTELYKYHNLPYCSCVYVCVSMQNSLSNIMQSEIAWAFTWSLWCVCACVHCTVISVWFPAFKHLCHIYPDDKWDDTRCKVAYGGGLQSNIQIYIRWYWGTQREREGEREWSQFYTFEKFPETEPIMLERESVDGIKAICGVCLWCARACMLAGSPPNVPAHLTSFHIQVI